MDMPMNCMGMMGGSMGGVMMLASVVLWLLAVAVLVLGVLALLKYLRPPRR